MGVSCCKGMGGCGVERRRMVVLGSLVLMSRRTSSGPPWSVPQPPDPGHPWS